MIIQTRDKKRFFSCIVLTLVTVLLVLTTLELHKCILLVNKLKQNTQQPITQVIHTPPPNYTQFPTFTAEVTAYTAGIESTGKTESHPLYGVTASGTKVTEKHTIAMGKDFPFGTKVIIQGFEGVIFEVEDRGGAITDNKIDIYMQDLQKAQDFGRQHLKVYILQYGESK